MAAPSTPEAFFLDNGADQIKAARWGVGGCLNVPNLAVKPAGRGVAWIQGSGLSDVPLPTLAHSARPTDRGYAMRWDLQVKIWDETFTLLEASLGGPGRDSDSSLSSLSDPEGFARGEAGKALAVAGDSRLRSAGPAEPTDVAKEARAANGATGAKETVLRHGDPEDACPDARDGRVPGAFSGSHKSHKLHRSSFKNVLRAAPGSLGELPDLGNIDLLCTCPPCPPPMVRDAYFFVALRHYGFRSFYRAPGVAYAPHHPALQDAAVGVVLDMGASGCTAAAFAHNEILEHSIFRTDAGGFMLDHLYAEALASRAAEGTPFRNLKSRPKLLSLLRINGLANVEDCRVLELSGRRRDASPRNRRNATRGGAVLAKSTPTRQEGDAHTHAAGGNAETGHSGVLSSSAIPFKPSNQNLPAESWQPGSETSGGAIDPPPILATTALARGSARGDLQGDLSKKVPGETLETAPGEPQMAVSRPDAPALGQAEAPPLQKSETGRPVGAAAVSAQEKCDESAPAPIGAPQEAQSFSLGKFALAVQYSEKAGDFVIVKSLTSELLAQGQTPEDLRSGKGGAIAQMEEATAIPRALFYPKEFGLSQKGVVDVVLEAIRALPPEIQGLAKKNVFCFGGLAYMRGLVPTLSSALRKEGVELTSVPNPERVVVDSMRAFHESAGYAAACVTADEYQERGAQAAADAFL